MNTHHDQGCVIKAYSQSYLLGSLRGLILHCSYSSGFIQNVVLTTFVILCPDSTLSRGKSLVTPALNLWPSGMLKPRIC